VEQAYRDVWEAFGPTGDATILFAIDADGTPQAALFLVRNGHRVVEPYGGMTVDGGALRANYLLKWEAIRRAREAGAATYDLWGLANPGIAHFKTGFGGREVRFIGAWDLVLSGLGRRTYLTAQGLRVGRARRRAGLAATGAPGLSGAGDGASGTGASLVFDGRVIRVGAFPISVDSVHINELVKEPAVQARAQEIREEMGNPELILLGVDRLDYTKGIEQRIKAVAELFAEGLLVAKRHVMVQIAVPSRESDAHYDRERHKLEQSVSAVNGEFAHLGSPVVHYIHKNLPFEELVALYLAADIMMVTPFRDGMNLVAKEYVVSRADLTGRLVLSEFAGAAEELRGAYKVNPHDLESIKMAIRAAKAASAKETRARMSRMRRKTDRRDVFDWAQSFLSALQAQDPAGLASSDD